MLRSNLARVLIGAAMLAVALGMQTGGASADKRIQISSAGNINLCVPSTHGYLAEAIGTAGGSQILCQAWNQGGTVTAQCPDAVTTHYARVTKRKPVPNGQLIDVVKISNPQSWGNLSEGITYEPSECPGLFITVYSFGKVL